jgi:hypothetical protein
MAFDLDFDGSQLDMNDTFGVKSITYMATSRMVAQMSAQMQETAITYESTKKYHLGSTFHGFKGTTFGYFDAVTMLNRIDLRANGHDVEGFLNKIMNTASGALLENEKSFREEARLTLALAVAHFLFDDWDDIGRNMASATTTGVHVFRLSDILVPLSYLLLSMAQALRSSIAEARSVASIRFNFPKILYPTYPQSDTSAEAS